MFNILKYFIWHFGKKYFIDFNNIRKIDSDDNSDAEKICAI